MVTSIGCSSFRVVLSLPNHYPRFTGAPFHPFNRSLIPAPSVDWGLDVGVVAVAAALGGLVLNAGLNLTGTKRKETVQVAQKFIAVVILMVIFLPALHFVDLMDGIDLNSFEPASMEAWLRGFFFWLGAISFYVGIGLFIVALVDLVYAMIGIENVEGPSVDPHQANSCSNAKRDGEV